MALTNGPDTHHEAQTAAADASLVGVHHHARIAEGGALNRVFARKGRPQEQAPVGGQFAFRVEAIGELVCVAQECLGQAMMSALESFHDIVKAPLNLVVWQLQDALQDCG
jgi:hypothetical protein